MIDEINQEENTTDEHKDEHKDEQVVQAGDLEEIKALKDSILRQKAETENLRKRHIKELEDSNKYAVTNFARDLIEVLENLHRATDSVVDEKSTEAMKAFLDGVNLTKNSLINTFEKHGIKRIHPIDEKFDHNFHQAIVQVDDETKEPSTVVQVIQTGYMIKDRLLRPALVAVTKG